jgi:hypothetical protein
MHTIDRLRPYLRHPDVTIDSSVVFLGCSFVWGTGLEDSETITSQFTELTGLKSANLGVCGGSSSLIAEIITSGCLDSARAVVIAWPHLARDHLWAGSELVCLGPWTVQGQPRPESVSRDSWAETMLAWSELLASGQAERQALDSRNSAWLLKQPYIEFTYYERLRLMGLRDLARDNQHPGPESNRQLASWLASWAQQRIIK